MRHGMGWAAAWLGVVLALAAPAGAQESRWALLVGIDEYVDPGISPLTGSVADVVAMREALVTAARFPSGQVFLLTSDDPGAAPTTGNIMARLKYIAENADSDDLVYVHFSLHAVVDDATGEGYLYTHRTDPNDYRRDGLPLREVRDLLESMVAPKQLLVLDGCRNDPERGKGDQPNHLDDRFSRGVKIKPRTAPAEGVSFSQVLFACSVGQRAYEWPGKERGLFSVALEEGLRGEAAKDGTVTLGGLTAYVRSRVPELIKLHLPGRQQTPDVPEPPLAAAGYRLADVVAAAPGSAQLKAADLPAVSRRASGASDHDLEAVVKRKAEKDPRIELTEVPAAPLTRTQARRITFRWEAEVDTGVAETEAYRWRLNDGEIRTTPRGYADIAAPEPGTHTFQVQVQDHWGNWSAPAKVEFTVLPNRKPEVSFASPKAGARIEGERLAVELKGSDPDGSVTTWRLALNNPDRFQENATGAFSLPAPSDGPLTLFAQTIDDEGAASLWQTLAVNFRLKEPDRAPPPAAAPTGAVAGATSPSAHTWTKGQPAPTVEGFKLVGNNAQGYPEYDKDLGAGATMRFVLVPAGSFQMGSPENEPGRDSDEGPQRRVTLDAFLLAKTECTQAQWQAVMGSNPSYFKNAGPTAPVEQVSWDDIQGFEQKTGLTLPSEAQWEYACRAGTTTALYTGPLTIRGQNHGPELDAIAWYGGNSGVDYEGGWDSSGWSEKQINHSRAGTHPVGKKQANAFGLHDMLGNVWEWCEDTWHDTYSGAPTNGAPWIDSGSAGRVSRGGGWINLARHCRSANRYGDGPGNRRDTLGCRLSRPLR